MTIADHGDLQSGRFLATILYTLLGLKLWFQTNRNINKASVAL
jgi:hypothetical protein